MSFCKIVWHTCCIPALILRWTLLLPTLNCEPLASRPSFCHSIFIFLLQVPHSMRQALVACSRRFAKGKCCISASTTPVCTLLPHSCLSPQLPSMFFLAHTDSAVHQVVTNGILRLENRPTTDSFLKARLTVHGGLCCRR